MKKTPKIMIIDANDLFRKTLTDLLGARFSNISWEEARSPKEALGKLNDFHPDIIFLDIKFPRGNGLKLIKKIKDIHPDAIVITLTSFDLSGYKEAAGRKGSDYFLSKDSSTAEEILALVGSILSNKGHQSNT